jgi:hypothetical protein
MGLLASDNLKLSSSEGSSDFGGVIVEIGGDEGDN